MANEDTEINLTTPLESKSYVQMTEEILKKHAIKILTSKDFMQLQISSDQTFRPQNHKVPGDFSSAAFLLAAAAISPSKVKVKNLDSQTKQGDKTILNILTQMGSKIRVGDGYIEEANGRLLKSVNIDARDIPDLVPICAVLACYSRGSSVIYNAKRLRYKESDRLLSLHTELRKMGAKILMEEDSLIIKGPCEMHGAIIDPHNDHRIAMACTVAALGATGETTIQDFECVRKSYPTFFNDLQSLGANISWRQIR
jgi:3-phosphoshikimate 1-carboxyvinyltransferase